MNLSPGGLDEPGFPYFASDKFDFGYGGPPFHPHDSPFFPGHPPPGMPFNPSGKINFTKIVTLLLNFSFNFTAPMDHSGQMPMVNDFGGMTPEASFLNQPNGPPIAGANPSDRPNSPEFMSTGNFSENANINEGLVW